MVLFPLTIPTHNDNPSTGHSIPKNVHLQSGQAWRVDIRRLWETWSSCLPDSAQAHIWHTENTRSFKRYFICLSLNYLFNFGCICVCLSIVDGPHKCGCPWRTEEVSDPLKLDLEMVVSLYVATENWTQEQHWAIIQLLICLFLSNKSKLVCC